MTAPARDHGTSKAPVKTWLLGWNAMMVCGIVPEDCSNLADGKLDVKHDLIIATSAVAGFSSILFGLCTNLPVGLG
jgi:xanthine/uracil/vitamin C permease (AzgA family)